MIIILFAFIVIGTVSCSNGKAEQQVPVQTYQKPTQ
jgi:hypothetical protein